MNEAPSGTSGADGDLPEEFGHCPDALNRLLEARVRPELVMDFRPWPRLFALRLGFHHSVFRINRGGTRSGICGAFAPKHALNERRCLHEFAEPGETGRLGHFGEHSINHCRALSFAGEELTWANSHGKPYCMRSASAALTAELA